MTKAMVNFTGLPVVGSLGSLDAYKRQVNTIPMLTAEEELSLSQQLHDHGDLAAAKRLVMSHLRFVVSIARGYDGYGLSQADLIQEGNIGLMKAVKRFNPAMGVRLVSFAVHWIKSEMHEFILRNWRIVRIATTKAQRKLFFNLRKMRKRFSWFNPTEVIEVANALNVKPEDVRQMEVRLSAHDEAFDAPFDDSTDDFQVAPADYLQDERFSPSQLIEHSNWSGQREQNLQLALHSLDQRSQDILQRRWLAEDKITLQDLAKEYQVSAERIRQIEKQAMDKLKAAMGE